MYDLDSEMGLCGGDSHFARGLQALAQQVFQAAGAQGLGRFQGFFRQVFGIAQVDQGREGVLHEFLPGRGRARAPGRAAAYP